MGTIYRRVVLTGLAIALAWSMVGPAVVAPVRRMLNRGILISVALPGDLRAEIRIGQPLELPLNAAPPAPCLVSPTQPGRGT